MANDEYREQHERDRQFGLKARQETRQERAIRRQVANEIADEIEAFMKRMSAATAAEQLAFGSPHNYLLRSVEIAREIGSREAGE